MTDSKMYNPFQTSHGVRKASRCCALAFVAGVAALSTVLLFGSCSNPLDESPSDDEGDWILNFNDEFEGIGEPDFRKWDRPEYNRRAHENGPDGWWLREDSYLDGEGHLVIRAKQIENKNGDQDLFDYLTGAVRSKGKFEQRYGKFEIRCLLPSQQGWWVAFWLFSESVGIVDGSGEDGTEIDIFEGFGWTDAVQHALHWDGYGEDHQSTSEKITIDGIRQGYHVFTLEWNESEYIFFVDGEETWRTRAGGVSKVPAYVKITGELSTESWAVNEYWANDPAEASFPDYFLVDYVRVYRK